jgi:hypothetical protein
MKALSIRQPWAWAILYLGKRIENRTWYSGFRGPIYIHAGKTVDRESVENLEFAIQKIPEPRPKAYLGALVGTAVVKDCVRVEQVPDDQQKWANGPWCFVLDDVRPLDQPIACVGKLGFFAVTETQ